MASQVSRMLAMIKPHPQVFYETKDRGTREARRASMTRDMKTLRHTWEATGQIKGIGRTKRRAQMIYRKRRNFTPPGVNEPYVKEKKDG